MLCLSGFELYSRWVPLIAAGRLVANHGNKGRPFRLALPRADYCDNSAERKLLMPVKRAEGPKLYVCFCRPPFLIPSQTFYIWVTHGPKFLHVNPT